MTAEVYKQRFKSRLMHHFDFIEDIRIAGVTIDVKADSHRRNEAYLITKKNKMYGFDNYESFLLLMQPNLTVEALEGAVRELEAYALAQVVPDEEHMSTDYTLVFHVDRISQEVEAYVKRYGFNKSFALGFRGHLRIGLVVVSASGDGVYSRNRRHKRFKFLSIEEG